jgi:N-acetylmuramoyl-L-alanine amidase
MTSAHASPPSAGPHASTLRVGDRGPDVGELRRRLALLDHDTAGDERNLYGDATEEAVVGFQDSRGLEPTGVCDPSTWTALLESEHRLGDRMLCLRSPMLRGEDVADLQLRLGTLGFDSGRVDGIFGPLTQRAVGEFQRNAGIVSDEVCGPDTVAALLRLAGRAGSATLASVRERIRLQRADSGLGTLRIVLGAPATADPLIGGLTALLAPHGAAMRVVDGGWSDQAAAANEFDADVYVGIDAVAADIVEAHFFATDGFESIGGRALAELVVDELPATGVGIARGMRSPILRETRAPAVLVKLGRGLHAPAHHDLVATSLQRALERWRHAPVPDTEP